MIILELKLDCTSNNDCLAKESAYKSRVKKQELHFASFEPKKQFRLSLNIFFYKNFGHFQYFYQMKIRLFFGIFEPKTGIKINFD